MELSYQVRGMNCDHCVQAVTKTVSALPTVGSVRVDLPTGTISVTSAAAVPLDDLRAAVDDAGFELIGAAT
ncbi:copper chaperone CopZ [Micromonospora sp. Llam0]|uniref:heavy-metal-associated domain-containing protein n=1 Tax=Micromonospora sp. Llam0 TaxID=2485143 RepID=UPI000F498CDB|nr:heavy metal-associated domain-containing protein [Micromonospora sp. Llam0]ROO60513.1 copper chaperone CopZ [Micromonospora sp. Llam0]